jgi:Nickel responsive protein SCO4226-like
MTLRKFIIEREIPKVGSLDSKQLSDAAAKSNDALSQIGADDIQWVESYVGDDKTFCVYLAKDADAIRKHAQMSGFPANKIVEVRTMIDPSTAK